MSDPFATPWTVACQAPLSMGFPRQEHWRGLPFPSPGDLPDPGIELTSPALALSALRIYICNFKKLRVSLMSPQERICLQCRRHRR